MQLPEDFVRLMHEQYDASTADALCQALCETDPEVSIRLNPRKGQPLSLDNVQADPVPWCPDAYYLAERPAFTFDPLLHAGAYYVQEASSMYIAELIRKYLLQIQNSKLPLRSRISLATPSAFKIQNSGAENNSQLPMFNAQCSMLNVIPPAFTVEPDMPRIELNYNEALQYLRREAVRVPAPRGMVLLCYKGYVLGPGKCVGNRINNLYPEQWRIRTTYTTPFSLLGIQ